MAMRTDLIPEAGSYDYVKVNLPNYKKQQPKFEVVDFQYGKDYDEATGEGTLTLVYNPEVYKAILKYSEIMITVGWHSPSYNLDSEIFKGFVKDISYDKDTIKLELADKGVYLEQTGDVNFTKKKRSKIMEEIIKRAGLKPYVDFKGVEDKEMDYTSTSSTSGTAEAGATAGTVSGVGKSSCGNCSKSHPYKNWYATTIQNYCPACGKSGSMVFGRDTGGKNPCPNSKFGPEDNPIAEGHYFCCSCDADYCVVCGTDHGRYSRRLTIVAGPTKVSGPSATADGTGDTTSSQNKTYWDMLIELADPANLDLQMYVWSDYCIVEPVPDPADAKLFVDTRKNVFEDSVKVKEGDAMLTNNIIVNYGQGKSTNSIKVQEDRLVDKYGLTQPKKYNKPKMNAAEAKTFARKELNRLLRDSGFQIELDTFGHPSYYIGKWVKTDLHRYDIHDTYYISKFSIEVSADQPLKSSLMLVEYRPTLELQNKTGSNNLGNLEGIMKEAAKFRYSHSCSEMTCLVATGQGDCWAHSDWLYTKLIQAGIRARILQYRTSASPRHRSVQIYQNGAWVDAPYKQYNVNKLFRATTNKPGAFVYKGG